VATSRQGLFEQARRLAASSPAGRRLFCRPRYILAERAPRWYALAARNFSESALTCAQKSAARSVRDQQPWRGGNRVTKGFWSKEARQVPCPNRGRLINALELW